MGSKIEKARKQAYAGKINLANESIRDFEKDLLKHHIRVNYWLPRVQKLLRARGIKQVKYLSLCGRTALDARLLKQNNILDTFVYCEENQKEFETIQNTYKDGIGFSGKLETIASDTTKSSFGKFWSYSPYDVINLDFWGDIHQASSNIANTFFTIQSMISRQMLSLNPYELWVTWRVKTDRISTKVENAYQELLDHNKKISKSNFNKEFTSAFPKESIETNDLVRIGFISWLLHILKREFSVIDTTTAELLCYTRNDKNKNSYKVYNFLAMIKPYDDVFIHSPVCDAAKFCERKYNSSLTLCLKQPKDIDKDFKNLTQSQRDKLKKNLDELVEEFNRALYSVE